MNFIGLWILLICGSYTATGKRTEKLLNGGELVSTERDERKVHAGVGHGTSSKHSGSQKWQQLRFGRLIIK